MNHRQRMSLSGIWKAQPDLNDDGVTHRWFARDLDTSWWIEARVPGTYESTHPALDRYRGVVWYRLDHLPRAAGESAGDPQDDRSLMLEFGAINNHVQVWVDGEKVGENHDPFLPFQIDLSHMLPSGPQSIVLRVDNSHHPGDVPGMHVGWDQAGGVIRDVALCEYPLIRLGAVSVNGTGDGNVSVQGVVAIPPDGDATTRPFPAATLEGLTASVEFLDATGESIVTATGAIKDMGVSIESEIDDPQLWSPESPTLYTARITLLQDDQPLDQVSRTFGFRTIGISDGRITLNGDPVFMKGFNRHDESSATGAALDPIGLRYDLEMIKETGANTIRLCHYPHDPLELDLCDQLGLLVFCEIPLYFWDNETEGLKTNAERLTTAHRQLKTMISRDRSHPSVFAWSVSNETNEEHPQVAEGNRDLIRYARGLDSTRLCLHVSDRYESHPNFVEDDVICINGYPSLDYNAGGHAPDADLSASAKWWESTLADLRAQYPGKPILVTEFGYGSLRGTHGTSLGEDEHARTIEVEFQAIKGSGIATGALVWCWADHRWPSARFLGLLESPFGVVTRDRRKLKPFDTTRNLFSDLPAGDPAERPLTGDGVYMIRQDLKGIQDVPLPAGYSMDPMTRHDIALWTDIQRDAEKLFVIESDLFLNQFGMDLQSIGWRCFLLRDDRRVAAGTMSAWQNRNFKGGHWGQVHWVALRPAYQGRKLASAMLSFTLKELRRYHSRAYLGTDVRRIPAIGLYLKFGFVPDMEQPNAQEAWTKLAQSIDHPAVRRALQLDQSG